MVFKIQAQNKNGQFCGTVSQNIAINAPITTLWKTVGNYTGLAEWVVDVKKTESISKIKNDFGAVRDITFADNSHVIECAVGWKDEQYLSYIATSGLPLDGYHATISISQKIKSSQVKWESFLISQDSEKKKFSEFLEFMDSFYFKSLERLKENIEKAN